MPRVGSRALKRSSLGASGWSETFAAKMATSPVADAVAVSARSTEPTALDSASTSGTSRFECRTIGALGPGPSLTWSGVRTGKRPILLASSSRSFRKRSASESASCFRNASAASAKSRCDLRCDFGVAADPVETTESCLSRRGRTRKGEDPDPDESRENAALGGDVGGDVAFAAPRDSPRSLPRRGSSARRACAGTAARASSTTSSAMPRATSRTRTMSARRTSARCSGCAAASSSCGHLLRRFSSCSWVLRSLAQVFRSYVGFNAASLFRRAAFSASTSLRKRLRPRTFNDLIEWPSPDVAEGCVTMSAIFCNRSLLSFCISERRVSSCCLPFSRVFKCAICIVAGGAESMVPVPGRRTEMRDSASWCARLSGSSLSLLSADFAVVPLDDSVRRAVESADVVVGRASEEPAAEDVVVGRAAVSNDVRAVVASTADNVVVGRSTVSNDVVGRAVSTTAAVKSLGASESSTAVEPSGAVEPSRAVEPSGAVESSGAVAPVRPAAAMPSPAVTLAAASSAGPGICATSAVAAMGAPAEPPPDGKS
mmetsp:Transcript_31856/g.112123  ORF Transcript_31856/g.112123 Transcript_31856/m.112123 type:complete len:543 (-) Transcript_31856:9-1637(-)